MADYQGGCLCGAVRYSFTTVVDAGYCHCSRCRRTSGAPVWAWAQVRGFGLTEGTPGTHESRRFCTDCGCSLLIDGDPVEVSLATLDEPARIEPQVHRCNADQLPWLKRGDKLPCTDGAELGIPAERVQLRPAVDSAVGRDSTVSLREVTKANLRSVLLASVAGSQQRFVASNAISLAQAHIHGNAWHWAIYADETVVGFAMATKLKEDEFDLMLAGDPELWRFMIDERYQGHGFGKKALEQIVSVFRGWGGANIWTSCVPGAGSPYEFYKRSGFTDTGIVDEREVILQLPLS